MPRATCHAPSLGTTARRSRRSCGVCVVVRYADQDEEDRRLALLALGHGVDGGNDAAAAPAPSPAPATDAAPIPTPVECVLRHMHVLHKPLPLLTAPCARRLCRVRRYSAEEVAEREKMRKLMAGRGDLVPGISKTDGDAGVIAGLLPTVPEGATIVNVVAVCAPLTSVMACKYKVRLLPGKLKKGKTAKAAMHMMETWSQCTGREKEFVKGLVDEDVVRVVVRGSGWPSSCRCPALPPHTAVRAPCRLAMHLWPCPPVAVRLVARARAVVAKVVARARARAAARRRQVVGGALVAPTSVPIAVAELRTVCNGGGGGVVGSATLHTLTYHCLL